MRKPLLLVSVILVLALLATSCGGQKATTSIKIGGVLELTGGLASLGNGVANGAKIAVAELNAKGGILGKTVELVVRDCKTDPVVAGTAATELIEVSKVKAMIGLVDSDLALAVGPVCQKNGIPYMSSGATSPKLPGQIGNTFFMSAFGDNTQAAAAAEYAYKELGARTAYVLWEKGIEYTTVLAKYFEQRWKELAGPDSVLLNDFYLQGDPKVSGQITKLRSLTKQPDVLFIASEPDDCGVVVKQFRDAGLNQPIFGGDAYDTPLLTQVATGVSDVYYTAPSLLAENAGSEMGQKFYKEYVKTYGHAPESAFPALGYDSIMALAKAMEDAGSTDGAKVIAALEKFKNVSAVAGNLTFGPNLNDHTPMKQVAIIRTVKGQLELAAMYAPEKVPAP
jgi:branched-chain amino acid transport system substrate-binding protein